MRVAGMMGRGHRHAVDLAYDAVEGVPLVFSMHVSRPMTGLPIRRVPLSRLTGLAGSEFLGFVEDLLDALL